MATKKTAKQIREEKELQHGMRLQRIFPAAQASGLGPKTLYAAVRRLEKRGGRIAEMECNEPEPAPGFYDRAGARIMKQLDQLLGFKAAGVPVFLNGDPRGYALKINDEYVRAKGLEIEKDWGGYGIIAPEF